MAQAAWNFSGLAREPSASAPREWNFSGLTPYPLDANTLTTMAPLMPSGLSARAPTLEFDERGMTPLVAAAWRKVAAQYPREAMRITAIRVNPALRGARLDGQLVGSVIEVNPNLEQTPDDLEQTLSHELLHLPQPKLDPQRLGTIPARASQGAPVLPSQPGLQPVEARPAPPALPLPARSFLEWVRDLSVSATKGLISVPEAAIGLADIAAPLGTLGVVKGGAVGKALESVGFKPAEAKQILDTYYSEQQQRANRSVAEAEGLVDTAVAAITHPSVVMQTMVESIPLMLAGGVVGRSLAAAGVSGVPAGAIGEGAASAGSSVAQIRAERPTGDLPAVQASLALASGAVTSGLGVFGAKLAARLGIIDVDTLLAAGVKNAPARRKMVEGIILGAVNEGFVEELPQSAQEQIAQNLATGKPAHEGVNQAAVLGALAGAVMGGGANVAAAAVPGGIETPASVKTAIPAVPVPAESGGRAGLLQTAVDTLLALEGAPGTAASIPRAADLPRAADFNFAGLDAAPVSSRPEPTEGDQVDVQLTGRPRPQVPPREALPGFSEESGAELVTGLRRAVVEAGQPIRPREQEVPTPAFEAPFSLTPEVSTTPPTAALIDEPLWPISGGSPERAVATLSTRVGQWLDRVRGRTPPAPRPVYIESGRSVPAAQTLDANRVEEFPSLQKMPLAIRGDIAFLLHRYQGFEAQRRGVQPVARTQALAADVRLPLETLRPGTALNAEELEAYKTALATTLTERNGVLDKIKEGTATDRDKLEFSRLSDVAVVLTASYRGAKAEAGRALNILKAKARVLDLQEGRFLQAALQAPGFHEHLAQVAQAATEAAGDPLKQLQLLRQQTRGSWFDLVQAAYYTNLLSGVKTHLRNAIGNSANAVTNLITPLGAAPADVVRAWRTGRPRTVYLREMTPALTGALLGVDRGFHNAAFTFTQGFRPATVQAAAEGKFDAPRVELPGGLWTNWPGRSLEAADEFFRAIARSQELYAGAYAQARSEGVTTTRATQARMATLLTATDLDTTDGRLAAALHDQADRFAARAVFQEASGPILRWLLKAKSPTAPVALRAAALFVSPFLRTPANILRQGFEASPAGFMMSAVSEPGRPGAQAQGRAVLGTLGLLGAVAWLAASGRLTGAAPEDPGEREEFYAQGKLTNAVKIGRTWVRYVLFQPWSVSLAAVANAWTKFQASEQDEAAAQEAFMAGLAGAGASLLDQSFLAGLGTFVDAVNDPDRYAGRWLSLFAQGLVPYSGLLRNVTQAVDPIYRRPEGVAESVQAILPGASTTLRPRRTRFGETATRPGPWWQRGFLVPEVSREVDDIVTQTLARLHLRPTVPRPTWTERGQPVYMSDAHKDVVTHAIGLERKAVLEALVRRPNFDRASDAVQRDALEDAIEAAARRVRARALPQVRRGQPLELDALISPLVRAQRERDRQRASQMLGKAAPNAARRPAPVAVPAPVLGVGARVSQRDAERRTEALALPAPLAAAGR